MKAHEELLPVYEDTAHLVRRIVREELHPVVEELRTLREVSDRSDEAPGPRGSGAPHRLSETRACDGEARRRFQAEDSVMNCYDCAVTARFSEAVGICSDCGSGVCIEHAVMAAHHLTRLAVIDRVERVDPSARVLRCETCSLAHEAAVAPEAATRRRGSLHPLGASR
jgi:hypothetical protein